MKVIRKNCFGKKFFDSINFPYGFSRSGDFSINEVRLLEHFGHLCSALQSEVVANPSETDKRFLSVLKGEIQAETDLELVWLKYLRLCGKNQVVLRPNKLTAHLKENKLAVDSF